MIPPLADDGLPKGWPQDHGIGTLATDALAWSETELAQPDGDNAGEDWRWRESQARYVAWWYAIDGQGKWLWRRGQIVLPKGAGKSPLAAALSCIELAGPVRFDGFDAYGEPVGRPHPSPWVQLAAVSQDQTDNTMSLVLAMLREGHASRSVRGLDAGITRVRTAVGVLQPVTASAPSREGQRTTAAVLDEALALDSVLPTPTGWTTMGQVASGDWLVGSDGKPVRVLKATDVQYDRQCYRVTFADGSSVVTSDGHLWATTGGRRTQVRSTGDMVRKPPARPHRVPTTPFVARESVDLPVDPYALGVWLGDGSTGQMYVTAAEGDADEIADYLREAGFRGEVTRPPNRACRIKLSEKAGFQGASRNPASKALHALSCFKSKHVPESYLRGSVDQVRALVQGLMDTDGHVGVDGYCTFVGTERLANDLVRALRSLGQAPRVRFVADVRSRHGGYFKVHFAPRHGLVPFRMRRKVNRCRSTAVNGMSIVSIEPVASVPVRCVAVDSDDHLFAIGDGLVLTHNSHLWTATNGGKRLAATIRRNLGKMAGRSIETTNTWVPGELSVAEETAEYARKGAEGLLVDAADPGVLRWHPSAKVDDMGDPVQLRAGLEHLYGDAPWVDVDRLVAEVYDLGTDPEDAQRFYLNQITAASDAWISGTDWAGCLDRDVPPEMGDVVVLGFDGSRGRAKGKPDATALVGCRVENGHLFEVAVWEASEAERQHWDTWEPPLVEIEATLTDCFDRYSVVGFYADPAKDWRSYVNAWEARWGSKLKVKASHAHPVEWWMTGGRSGLVQRSIEQLEGAIRNQDVSHDGSLALTRHVLNARRRLSHGKLALGKSSDYSDRKIDAAVAACLAWQCRLDALAAGVGKRKAATFIPSRIR